MFNVNNEELLFVTFDSANEAFRSAYDVLMPVKLNSLQMTLVCLKSFARQLRSKKVKSSMTFLSRNMYYFPTPMFITFVAVLSNIPVVVGVEK